jgi:hypothetical protein
MLTFGVNLSLRSHGDTGPPVAYVVRELIREWYRRKLGVPDAAQRKFEHRELEVGSGSGRVWEFSLSQRADDGGDWTTELRMLSADDASDRATLTVVMRLASDADFLAPVRYHVESPKFLRELPDHFHVTVGSAQVDSRDRMVTTSEDVEKLVAELGSPERALPLVVVTDPCPIPRLAESLAWFLFGLAGVVHVDRPATFELTKALGKEMSCFDGGVRLYWPRWSRYDPPRRHPLYLGKRLAISALQDPRGADRPIRSTLMSILSRAAAARFVYPKEILAVLAEHHQNEIRTQLREVSNQELIERVGKLQSDLDYQTGLAEMAIAENAELRDERDELVREVDAAKREMERLRRSLAPDTTAAMAEDSPWNIEDPIEAVERARTDFGRTLIIPSGIPIETRETGGFWYHALLSLHELCERERRGDVKNKREVLRELLGLHLGIPKGTYKSAETGLFVINPEDGSRLPMRERVHLKEGKPTETESLYWQMVGKERSSYRYIVGRIGRHG